MSRLLGGWGECIILCGGRHMLVNLYCCVLRCMPVVKVQTWSGDHWSQQTIHCPKPQYVTCWPGKRLEVHLVPWQRTWLPGPKTVLVCLLLADKEHSEKRSHEQSGFAVQVLYVVYPWMCTVSTVDERSFSNCWSFGISTICNYTLILSRFFLPELSGIVMTGTL